MTTSSDIDWPRWSIESDPAELGRYIVPDAVAKHAMVPLVSGESPECQLQALWNVLRAIKIGYAHEPPGDPSGTQRIRSPGEVLVAPRSGTCLDLALVMAGACELAGLPATVILLDAPGGGIGHALVAIGLGDWWPLSHATTAMPDGLVEHIAISLTGPPRDIVVVDPNALAVSLGATATAGLDGDLDEAIGAGYSLLTDGRWSWRLSANAACTLSRYQPARVPASLPLRQIYQHPDAAGSVLALVRPEYELTPFQARDELLILEDFAQQIAAGDRTGLVVVHGTGGSGKTRLALELADRFRKLGWYAGPLREFVTAEERPQRSESLGWLATVTTPLMVMVDYADAHPNDLIALLAVVKDRAGPPAVIVTTARTVEGDWLSDVIDAVTADLHPHRLDVIQLQDVHPQPRPVFENTFRKLNTTSRDSPSLPKARPGHSWTTLDLVLFGWLAATTEEELPTTRAALYEQILDHERKYWSTTYVDLAGGRADRRLLDTSAACLTLLGPIDLDTASESLKRVAVLADNGRWRRDIARTFEVCLSQRVEERWAIRPDPIGDHHLLAVLNSGATLLTSWLPSGTADTTLIAAFDVVQRASVDGTLFEQLLRADIARWPKVLTIASAVGGPARQALEALVGAPDTPLPLAELSEKLPFRPTGLWKLALLVDERRLQVVDPSRPEERAALLRRVSARRNDAGDHHGAVAAVIEAVKIVRQLARDNSNVYRSELAGVLNAFAALLFGSDAGNAAFQAITEAVNIYRRLAEDDPKTYLAGFAQTLTTLANFEMVSGPNKRSLDTISQAVAAYRQLLPIDPAAALPALATALNNLSGRQRELGDRDGALATIDKAVEIDQKLAEKDPDAFLPNLAMVLNTQSALLAETGRRTQALDVITHAVDIREKLVEKNRAAFLPVLANSLVNQSNHLAAIGRRAEATTIIRRAIDHYRELVRTNQRAYRAGLATALNNLSLLLSNSGDPKESLALARESVNIFREMESEVPGSLLPDLAASLMTLSRRLSESGHPQEARDAAAEVVRRSRHMKKINPMAARPYLAEALEIMSDALADSRDMKGAVKAAAEAVTIRRRLERDSPERFGGDLAHSLTRLSNRLTSAGRSDAALKAIIQAVSIYRTLEQDGAGTFRPELAMALNTLSVARSEAGDSVAARGAIMESVSLFRELGSDGTFRPELARALNNLSVHSQTVGEHEEGRRAAAEAVKISRDLVAVGGSDFLPLLAGSLNNMSNRLADLGDHGEALRTSEEAVEIQRELAHGDHVKFEPDLATYLGSLANRLAAAGDRQAALAAITDSVDLLRKLAASYAGAFHPRLAAALNSLSLRLSEAGESAKADDIAAEAVGILKPLMKGQPTRFRANYAISLRTLALQDAAVGDRRRSLSAATEAADLLLKLAQANPVRFLPDLATTLAVLSDELSRTGGPSDQPWHHATTRLPRLYRGWLRAHHADWLIADGRLDEAGALLLRAADEVVAPAPREPFYAVGAARQAVRDIAQKLPPENQGLPAWAHEPLPDHDLGLVKAWLEADDLSDRESVLDSYRSLSDTTTMRTSLDILAFTRPGTTGIEKLQLLITRADEHGYDIALDELKSDHEQHAAVDAWTAIENHAESLRYLRKFSPILTQPHAKQILAESDDPERRRHAAILTVSGRYPDEVFQRIAADPEEAANRALEAVEAADKDSLIAILAAWPAVAEIPGTGAFLRAVGQLYRGRHGEALRMARQAYKSLNGNARAANIIRLKKLLTADAAGLTGQFRSGAKKMIEVLTESEESRIRRQDQERQRLEGILASGHRNELPMAKVSLGRLLVTHDPDRAKTLFEQAIESGNAEALPPAQAYLGTLLLDEDPGWAEVLLRRAVMSNDLDSRSLAQTGLGRVLLERDPAEARTLFETAFDFATIEVLPTSQAYLGTLLLREDPERAEGLLEDASVSEDGHARLVAKVGLGRLLRARDPKRAIALFEEALESGVAEVVPMAQAYLGALLSFADPVRARGLLQAAVVDGTSHAKAAGQLHLAAVLLGEDPDRARGWFEAAMSSGDPEVGSLARALLGEFLIERDQERAEELLRLATESEHPDAKAMAQANLAGLLMSREPSRAWELLDAAVDSGSALGQTTAFLVLLGLGELTKAEQPLEHLRSMDSAHAIALAEMLTAILHVERGEIELARRSLAAVSDDIIVAPLTKSLLNDLDKEDQERRSVAARSKRSRPASRQRKKRH